MSTNFILYGGANGTELFLFFLKSMVAQMGHNFLFKFFFKFFFCFFDKSEACVSFVEPSILIHYYIVLYCILLYCILYCIIFILIQLYVVLYLRVIENIYITVMASVGFGASAVLALAYQNGDFIGSLNKKASGAQCFIMASGLFWDIVTSLPWTPNGVGSLEPKEYYIFLPGAHYLTINIPDGADSSLNKLLLLLLLPAQHSLLWCIEYWLHWLLQPFCCYQLRRLVLCAFIISNITLCSGCSTKTFNTFFNIL